MLTTIAVRLQTAAIATLPLLLGACGKDDGTGTQKFEGLELGLVFMAVLVIAEVSARLRTAMARARS